MSWLIGAITSAIAAFVATNIDDLLLLALFFTQVNGTFSKRHIIVGQYLGFTALLLASLPGFFGGLLVPRAFIGLLGLVPIAIGIIQLLKREETVSQVQAVADNPETPNPTVPLLFGSFVSSQTYSVAAVTIANGGDNIGIYVPLFASSDFARLAIILSLFFILIGVWCYLAYQIACHRSVTPVFTRYGKALVPVVLIGLGIYILLDSGTATLLL
jgi:cadmium resistance transport/sequestration family protein